MIMGAKKTKRKETSTTALKIRKIVLNFMPGSSYNKKEEPDIGPGSLRRSVYRTAVPGSTGGKKPRMNAIPIKNLAVDTVFDKPVYLDQKYLLLAPEVPVTKALLRDLITWEFREVYSDGIARSLAQEEAPPEDSGAAESGAASK